MTDRYIVGRRLISEKEIKDRKSNFLTVYYAILNLQTIAETDPGVISPDTVLAIRELLKSSHFSGQRQVFFLFRQAAETLISIFTCSNGNGNTELALSVLKHILKKTTGPAHRATAEALSTLPFSIKGPKISDKPIEHIARVTWGRIMYHAGMDHSDRVKFMGRSLICSPDHNSKLLVVKFARKNDDPDTLIKEAFWMKHLSSKHYHFPVRFNIPKAIEIDNAYIFRVTDVPVSRPSQSALHPKGYAIGFIADREYYAYPNSSRKEKQLHARRFQETIFRNAWLLGHLTSKGIIHEAPIPLFHNRVQSQRRRDQGLYEWFRGGRLDKWLDSCGYPNLGVTGIRDFEHLITFSGQTRTLYRYIGNHFLSLLLITGSYFRNKDTTRMGVDPEGNPVDARDLFDPSLLNEMIAGIFCNYYRGFVGNEYSGDLPFPVNTLVSRMIDEMGVDNHMEEILRVADQNEMTDKAFVRFLYGRGYTKEEIDTRQKGTSDIMICSGPHLGGFNARISIPELIESVQSMSALCVLGRYRGEIRDQYL